MTHVTGETRSDTHSNAGIRGWLRRQGAKRIAWPRVAVLTEVDVLPGLPAVQALAGLEFLPPRISEDFCLLTPDTLVSDVGELGIPDVSANLWDILVGVRVDGTLFFRQREEEPREGKVGPPVVTPSQRARETGRERPPNIFELLLPVLLPPMRTELGDELLLPKELRPYQAYGVNWLIEHQAALLADDMGTGKTAQAILAFRILVRQGRALQALVVCPKSVVPHWERELSLWAPELQVVRVAGAKEVRQFQWAAYANKCHVLLTNYETLVRDSKEVLNNSYDLTVADEAQRIKNVETATSMVMRGLRGKYRWGLTGTPLENRTDDIAGIFHFVKPGLFRRGVEPTESEASRRIEPFTLRRRKADVLKELPDKHVNVEPVDLTEEQRATYDEAERTGRIQLETGQNITVQHVLALITKLKQICNFDPATGESGKLEWLIEFIENVHDQDCKALVFSQFVETLKRIRPAIERYQPLMFTGETSDRDRRSIVEAFQPQPKSPNEVLLVSLKAGGVGLTLTAANQVVHFDSWWNPATMRQAEDRVHRIGQTKEVSVYTLVTKDTIEERIQKKLEGKRGLFDRVVDDLSDDGLQKVLSEEELFGLFGLKPRRALAQQRPTAPSQPAATVPSRGATVFRPEEPFSNVVKLRELLRSCDEYVWWADPHFGTRALEELAFVVDPSRVASIRILSRAEQYNDRAARDLKRFVDEMTPKGITVEWRVTARSVSHDRYIVASNVTYNVPPVNSIFQGAYGEGIATTNRPPFEEWWQQGRPV